MRVGGENNWGKNPVRVRDLRRKLFYLFMNHDHLKSEGKKEGAIKPANMGLINVAKQFIDAPSRPLDSETLDSEIEKLLNEQNLYGTNIELEVYSRDLNKTVNSSRGYKRIKSQTKFITQSYFAALLGFSKYKGSPNGPSKEDQLAYVVMSNIVHARACENKTDCKETCESMCPVKHRMLEFSCLPVPHGEEVSRYTYAPARALPRVARTFGFNMTWDDGEEDHFDPATWDDDKWPSDFSQHKRAWKAFAGIPPSPNVKEIIYGGTIKEFITAYSEMMTNAGPREMKENEGPPVKPRPSGGASRRPSSARPATAKLFKMDVLVGQWNNESAPLLLRQLVLNPGVIAQDDKPPVRYATTEARVHIRPEYELQKHLSVKGVHKPEKLKNSVTVIYEATESEMDLITSAVPGRCLPVFSLFNEDEPFKLAEIGVGAEPGSGLDIDLFVRRCDVRMIAADVDVNDIEGPKCDTGAPTMPAEGFARLLAEAETEGQTRSDVYHTVLRKRVVIKLPRSSDDNDWWSSE